MCDVRWAFQSLSCRVFSTSPNTSGSAKLKVCQGRSSSELTHTHTHTALHNLSLSFPRYDPGPGFFDVLASFAAWLHPESHSPGQRGHPSCPGASLPGISEQLVKRTDFTVEELDIHTLELTHTAADTTGIYTLPLPPHPEVHRIQPQGSSRCGSAG